MKVLFISMPSVHVIRWIENLKDTSLELFWFDVLGKGKLDTFASVTQFTNWGKRKIPYVKGEHYLKKNTPFLYNALQPFLEITASEQLEQIIRKIKPDVIHSFEMQHCSYPILKTMQKYPNIKWVYSCWGSDLYYYQNVKYHKPKIKAVLQRVDFLHTDCLRDYELAKKLKFKGKHTGVIPGGTGFKLSELQPFLKPHSERKIILVKGYHHLFGRGLNIIKALQELPEIYSEFEVVVFGAHQNVTDYISSNNLPFEVCSRHGLTHQQLLELMGQSLIYIGNNISDGMPNTLLEAIVMGAFPIQSNPGGVTAEIINHDENGLLINDPENVEEIKVLIEKAITNSVLVEKAAIINSILASERLEYEVNKNKITSLYDNLNEL